MNRCESCVFYREERDVNYFDCAADVNSEEIDKYWGSKLDCPFFVDNGRPYYMK